MVQPIDEIYVIGAGGHGKVAVRAAQARGIRVAAVFDDDPRKWGNAIYGVPIVGEVNSISRQSQRPTLLAIGDNARRLALAENLDLPWAAIVHPAAFVDSYARLGVGVLVLAGAVVQADSIIGPHSIINDNAIVEHDCFVDDGAHVSCGACLTGNVHVGKGALIGAGAIVLPGIEVGDFATVAAGAVVTRSVTIGATVVGVPARVVGSPLARVA